MHPATFRLVRGIDLEPESDRHGAGGSVYLEVFWLPILGPAATMLLRRFQMELAMQPDGVTIDLNDVGQELGIGTAESKHAPVRRALSRLMQFGMVTRFSTGQFAVPNVVKELPTHLQPRVSEALQSLGRRWVSAERADDRDLLASAPSPTGDPTGD
jgi:hypothetical protein